MGPYDRPRDPIAIDQRPVSRFGDGTFENLLVGLIAFAAIVLIYAYSPPSSPVVAGPSTIQSAITPAVSPDPAPAIEPRPTQASIP